MKTYNFELSEIANKYGVQVEESCDSMTGYPSHLLPCLTGFETMEDAEAAMNELNAMINEGKEEDEAEASLVYMEKRDGWHFWYRESPAYEMYHLDEDLKDNEEAWYSKNAEDWLNYRAETEDDEDYLNYLNETLEEYKANTQKVYEAIKNLKDNEFLMTFGADCTDGYFEIMKKRSMCYRSDVWAHEIGIVVYPL